MPPAVQFFYPFALPPDHLSCILYMLSFHNHLEKIVDIYKSTKSRKFAKRIIFMGKNVASLSLKFYFKFFKRHTEELILLIFLSQISINVI